LAADQDKFQFVDCELSNANFHPSMIINRQDKVSVDLRALRDFVERLRKCLRLGCRDFNVCFVRDQEMAVLNAAYRGQAGATDVLSFAWQAEPEGAGHDAREVSPMLTTRHQVTRKKVGTFEDDFRRPEFVNFLGDIVIAAETARRNARAEGHSTAREIRWLILHGVLHLVGHDHENDHGEMTVLEHLLRAKLKI
jgi:rRNA maturation RNase YbeY